MWRDSRIFQIFHETNSATHYANGGEYNRKIQLSDAYIHTCIGCIQVILSVQDVSSKQQSPRVLYPEIMSEFCVLCLLDILQTHP